MGRPYAVLKYVCFVLIFFSIVDLFGVFKHFVELDFTMNSYPMRGNVLEYAHNKRFNRHLEIHPINIYNYTFVHNSADKCIHKITSSVPIRLMFLIKSAIINFERRATIRKTWGNEITYPYVRIVFLLGYSNNKDSERLVKKEFGQFNDIVKSNFIDSYYNNTIKTLMGFRWVIEYCADSPYFMFVDDDYFVSTKNVIRYIKSLKKMKENISKNSAHNVTYFSVTKEYASMLSVNYETKLKNFIPEIIQDQLKLFAGFEFRSSPHRHKWSKWYIALNEYPFNMWPPYITAGAYIISRDALVEMYYVSLFTKHFKFDDIYLGLVALKAKINITHCDDFHFRKAIYSKPTDYTRVIASHGYGDPKELMRIWSECYAAGFA